MISKVNDTLDTIKALRASGVSKSGIGIRTDSFVVNKNEGHKAF
jgi:hypothetical protein